MVNDVVEYILDGSNYSEIEIEATIKSTDEFILMLNNRIKLSPYGKKLSSEQINEVIDLIIAEILF